MTLTRLAPWKLETDRAALFIVNIVVLFVLAVMPDYCAFACHARAVAVHLFCIGRDSKG